MRDKFSPFYVLLLSITFNVIHQYIYIIYDSDYALVNVRTDKIVYISQYKSSIIVFLYLLFDKFWLKILILGIHKMVELLCKKI